MRKHAILFFWSWFAMGNRAWRSLETAYNRFRQRCFFCDFGGRQLYTEKTAANLFSIHLEMGASMFPATTEKTELNTSAAAMQRFDQEFRENIASFLSADREAVEQRLGELDREWNVERVIEIEAPTMILLGLALGSLSNRKWFAVSAMAASMVILHNLQGWYPLLPIFRSMGLRTAEEIEQERMALKVLLGEKSAPIQSIH